MSSSNLDRVRGAALDRIERTERAFKAAFYLAAAVEAAFLLSFFFLADLKDRLHLLVGLAALAVYSVLATGLFALGAHVSRCTERVLRAMELSRPEAESRGGG